VLPDRCGIKVRWSEDELAKAATIAARPAKTFASRAEAMDRALRVAGLHGRTTELAGAITDGPDGWRLTLDNAAFGVGAPDLASLLTACSGTVLLAAGENDPMCPAEHLAEFGPPVLLAGCGHNAHVERPRALRPVLDRLLQAAANRPGT
jgi:pimeloyl-ACP methyl ester carboxylesterase